MRLGFSYDAHTQFFKATPRNAVNHSSKMEFREKLSALKRNEKEQGLACGGGIHSGWGVMWTWNRARSSAFDCSGSFAWANKSSHELFISASIREEIWLWLPASSVLQALWGGSSWFQSVSAEAFHAVVKTMWVDESHSPLGDPWKTCSVNGKNFYPILAGERLNH